MSLWPVQDEAARQWMRRLYEARLLANRGSADSVRRASLGLLRASRAQHLSTHPFYWGGFVAAGDSEFILPFTRESDGEAFPTQGASVGVDEAGGVHVAYRATVGDANGHFPAFYAYCAADCGGSSNWRYLELGQRVWHVNLALDAGGRPRIPLAGPYEELGTRHQYAVCDSDCTNRGNWTLGVRRQHQDHADR